MSRPSLRIPDAIAEALRLRQVVGGQHDGRVMAVAQLLDEGLHVQLRTRIEAGEG